MNEKWETSLGCLERQPGTHAACPNTLSAWLENQLNLSYSGSLTLGTSVTYTINNCAKDAQLCMILEPQLDVVVQ